MESPKVTIVVVPRERFSGAKTSLDSIYAHTSIPFNLVYIDGNSPKRVSAYLQKESEQRQFQLVRKDHYLSPNEARNLGLTYVETDYVVYVDNDLIVRDGWLEALIECAEQTGAWIVGPTYLIGKPENETVHLTSGEATFYEVDGKPHFKEHHVNSTRKLSDIQDSLTRSPCDFMEFHCLLMNTSRFRQIGELDEKLLTSTEYIDICLRAKEAGGETYHEPASVVTYVPNNHFLIPSDLKFYLWRSSNPANVSSLLHFQQKYGLDENDSYMAEGNAWLTYHRRRPVRWITGTVRVLFGMKAHARFSRFMDKLITPKNHQRELQSTDAAWAKN